MQMGMQADQHSNFLLHIDQYHHDRPSQDKDHQFILLLSYGIIAYFSGPLSLTVIKDSDQYIGRQKRRLTCQAQAGQMIQLSCSSFNVESLINSFKRERGYQQNSVVNLAFTRNSQSCLQSGIQPILLIAQYLLIGDNIHNQQLQEINQALFQKDHQIQDLLLYFQRISPNKFDEFSGGLFLTWPLSLAIDNWFLYITNLVVIVFYSFFLQIKQEN